MCRSTVTAHFSSCSPFFDNVKKKKSRRGEERVREKEKREDEREKQKERKRERKRTRKREVKCGGKERESVVPV